MNRESWIMIGLLLLILVGIGVPYYGELQKAEACKRYYGALKTNDSGSFDSVVQCLYTVDGKTQIGIIQKIGLFEWKKYEVMD